MMIGRAFKRGRPRKFTDEQELEIVRLRVEQNYSLKQISDVFGGCSLATIESVYKRRLKESEEGAA